MHENRRLREANEKLNFTGGGFKPNSDEADVDWRRRRIFA
jgi:hypothetical protein